MPTLIIGADYSAVIRRVKNAVSGAALTGATVTFQLYTAAGVAVSGASGTASYVAASAGTTEDAEFAGVIENATTATLTAGPHYILYTISSSGLDSFAREEVDVQAPGSVICDVSSFSASTGISVTAGSADELSIIRASEAVTDALIRKCYPVLLAPKTLTLQAFDAPPDEWLYLPRPIRSISALYLHPGAYGDSSLLDLTADLLTANVDYYSKADDVLNVWNRTGAVQCLRSSAWGWRGLRPLGKLGYKMVEDPGAIFVSGSFGPASVSAAVREAAARAVTQLYTRRKEGAAYASESWNGRSQSIAQPFSAEAAINSPEVLSLLRDVGALPVHVG